MSEMKNKLEGTAKEAMGTVTDDDSQKNEGRGQQTVGNAQGAANDVKDKVGNAVDNATSDDTHDTDKA